MLKIKFIIYQQIGYSQTSQSLASKISQELLLLRSRSAILHHVTPDLQNIS
jgi:hypothetical protein